MNNACNGAITVATGATIGGTGSVKGPITAATGSFIRPGDSSLATLTCANLTLVGNAKLYVNIVGATKDVLAVTGTLVMPAGPTALVELEAGSTPSLSTTYAVVTAGTYNAGGGANTFATTSLPVGWTVTGTDNVGISLTSSSSAAAIPTLNEWGLIILMMLLAGIGAYTLRRRHADAPMPV